MNDQGIKTAFSGIYRLDFFYEGLNCKLSSIKNYFVDERLILFPVFEFWQSEDSKTCYFGALYPYANSTFNITTSFFSFKVSLETLSVVMVDTIAKTFTLCNLSESYLAGKCQKSSYWNWLIFFFIINFLHNCRFDFLHQDLKEPPCTRRDWFDWKDFNFDLHQNLGCPNFPKTVSDSDKPWKSNSYISVTRAGFTFSKKVPIKHFLMKGAVLREVSFNLILALESWQSEKSEEC